MTLPDWALEKMEWDNPGSTSTSTYGVTPGMSDAEIEERTTIHPKPFMYWPPIKGRNCGNCGRSQPRTDCPYYPEGEEHLYCYCHGAVVEPDDHGPCWDALGG